MRSVYPSSGGYECYDTDFGTVMIKQGEQHIQKNLASALRLSYTKFLSV